MKYDIIIADPPWQYDGKTCVATKADDHYSVTKSKALTLLLDVSSLS